MSKINRFIAGSVFAMVLLLGAGAVPAQAASLTSPQIDAIIGLLQSFGADSAIVANVRSVLGGGGTTTQPWCHTFNTNMGVGATGAEVQALDSVLARENLWADQSSNFAAVYNEATAAAVVKFQSRYGVLQTGYVGPLTRGKLNSLYGCSNTQWGTSVITGVSGPVSLQIGQQGVWTVKATDPRNGTLSYRADWGEYSYSSANGANVRSSLPPVLQQNATFTHTYSYAGVYTATFTVTNASGQSAWTSVTVNVGGVPNQSIQVTYPNGGETLFRDRVTQIDWMASSIYATDNVPSSGLTKLPTVNIQLVPYYSPLPCSAGTACPMYYPYRASYTIAKDISITTGKNSYSWLVGKVYQNASTTDVAVYPSDGKYTIQVCRTDTGVCDQSNSAFTLQTIYTGGIQ